jgi:hypothetical protein
MMRLASFAIPLMVAACSLTSATTQTFLTDAGKAVTILQALDADAAALGAAPDITMAIGVALTAVQNADTELAAGKIDAAAFSTLLTNEVNQLGPTLLADFKSSTNIVTGVLLAQQLVTLIASEITTPVVTSPAGPVTAAASPDLRDQIDAWLSHQH